MRPRRLVAHAFGPFAGTLEIDFDLLAGTGLFLIHGPTGAGKTSILDAMCFALFGSVPGDRTVDSVRSHHAESAAEASVELEFSLHDDDWRVTRSPAQERPKKKGEGTTTTLPKATLARREGADWRSVAGNVSEVGAEIRRLIGLDAEQFQQVVLLPQGEFERALRADAKQREALLSTLFATHRFGRYADELGGRARASREALDECDRVLDSIRDTAIGTWREGLGEGDRDAPEPVDVAALTAELDAVAQGAGRNADTIEEQVDTARRACDEGRKLLASRKRRDELAAREAALADVSEQMQAKQAQLDAARRAAPLVDLIDRTASARADSALLAGALDESRRDSEQTVSVLPDAAAAVRDAVANWPTGDSFDHHLVGPAIDSLAQLRQEVSGLSVRSRKATAARGAEARLREAAATAASEAIAHDGKVAEVRAAQEAAKAEIQAAEVGSAQVAGLEADARTLAAAADAAERIAELDTAHTLSKKRMSATLDASLRAKTSYEALLTLRIENMAGELAAGLRAGDECPVCGSTEHPSPASAADAVSAADLDAAKTLADEAEKSHKKAEQDERTAGEALAEQRTHAGDAGDDPAEARRLAAESSAAATAAKAKACSLDELTECLNRLDAEASTAAKEVETAKASASEATSGADAERRVAVEHEQAVRDLLGDISPAEVEPAIEEAHDALKELQRIALDRTSARRVAANLERGLPTRLAQQGFETEEGAKSASLPGPAQSDLEEEILRHSTDLASVKERLAEPELANLPEAPDIESLDGALASASQSAKAARERATIAGRCHARLVELLAAQTAASAERQPAAQRALMLKNLAGLCRGVEGSKISLERFILGAYLEEITSAASQRLRDMSGGRYTLQFSNERLKGAAASGLSIRVNDAWTGRPRDVVSLSGGETFLASLALALAVADVVRHHQGGVELGALFVDEGFGSLDPEALDQALGVLDQLRAGGRLVGVISHVPAVKERIVQGIAVTPTTGGSVARVDVGGPA